MELEQSVRKIQYTWRLHRVHNVIHEALTAQIQTIAVRRLRTLQRAFRVKLRKRYLEVLVTEAVRRIERVAERDRIRENLSPATGGTVDIT